MSMTEHNAEALGRTHESLVRREEKLARLIRATERALAEASAEDWFTAPVGRLITRTMNRKLNNLRAKMSDIRAQRHALKEVLAG